MNTNKRLITLPWVNYYPAKPTPHKPRHWNISIEINCVQASASMRVDHFPANIWSPFQWWEIWSIRFGTSRQPFIGNWVRKFNVIIKTFKNPIWKAVIVLLLSWRWTFIITEAFSAWKPMILQSTPYEESRCWGYFCRPPFLRIVRQDVETYVLCLCMSRRLAGVEKWISA